MQENRRRLRFQLIDLSGRGCASGPYDQPTLSKSEANLYFPDAPSREVHGDAAVDRHVTRPSLRALGAASSPPCGCLASRQGPNGAASSSTAQGR